MGKNEQKSTFLTNFDGLSNRFYMIWTLGKNPETIHNRRILNQYLITSLIFHKIRQVLLIYVYHLWGTTTAYETLKKMRKNGRFVNMVKIYLSFLINQ